MKKKPQCHHVQSSFVWLRDVRISRFCDECGDRLSLGPSNDEPREVQVEIRAAEIVADMEHAHPGCEWRMHKTNSNENIGWVRFEHDFDIRPMAYTSMPDQDINDQLAGWLARQIVEHESNHETPTVAVPALAGAMLKGAPVDYVAVIERHAENVQAEQGVEVEIVTDHSTTAWCAKCDFEDDFEKLGEP